ncbi:MAG: lamin tail domain-containing protein, partial [Propionibacteriaceae bacterium]|nr:lamin tail domain-containing protein [Propionibacteriaceae bacterium]
MPALATILQKRRVALTTAVAVALIVPAGLTLGAPKAFASDAWTGGVIINEVYGGGGNSGAAFNQDFIELYNPTDAAIDLSGWSLQYG